MFQNLKKGKINMAIAEINGRYYQTINTFFEVPKRPQYKSDKRKWQLRISLSRIKIRNNLKIRLYQAMKCFWVGLARKCRKNTQCQVQTQAVVHVSLITMSSLKEIHNKKERNGQHYTRKSVFNCFIHHRIPCCPRCAKLVAPKLGGYWWKPPTQIEISTMGRWNVSDGIIDDKMVRS